MRVHARSRAKDTNHSHRCPPVRTLTSIPASTFWHDQNGDGEFVRDEVVAISGRADSNEFIELVDPPDGDYQIWVLGYGVEGSPTFELSIDAIQGRDIALSGVPVGPVPAGTPVTITVDVARPMAVGERYVGELLLGPRSAPKALRVPIVVDRV